MKYLRQFEVAGEVQQHVDMVGHNYISYNIIFDAIVVPNRLRQNVADGGMPEHTASVAAVEKTFFHGSDFAPELFADRGTPRLGMVPAEPIRLEFKSFQLT